MSRRERKRLAKKAGGATLEALSALYRGEGSDMARGIYRAWFEAAHNLTSSGLHQLVVNGWETYGLAPAGQWEEWYDRLYPARAGTSK